MTNPRLEVLTLQNTQVISSIVSRRWRSAGNSSTVRRRRRERHRAHPHGDQTDIEGFFDRLPEPIDLELDHKKRVLYWTDRGDPPRGNTPNRASINAKPQAARSC
jgi:hypothetical protein